MNVAVFVAHADEMMSRAELESRGIWITFANGRRGLVPFSDIPEIGQYENLRDFELPSTDELILRAVDGRSVALPWDFVRHYCDKEYRPRIEKAAATGRKVLGERIKHARKQAGLTQEALARVTKVARVTLARIERGDQSPRYDTLLAIAAGLNIPVEHLLVNPDAGTQEFED
ncbi:MAG: helix-turn-helix domain-containing protein [SAR202 cluster bacterium]|nr:helix-turn-helix domain-containing protein [SAR202 cluster bacterium]